MTTAEADRFDVVVVGAGIGGIYGVHRIAGAGFRVLGLEGAPDVGGVWYHNCYPGARVDVDSTDYCYLDPEIYRGWRWSERYAAQPEILRYLNFAADHYGIRQHYRFNTWLTGAKWDPGSGTYELATSSGDRVTTQFLVMATGQLSRTKTATFPGLETFKGKVFETSHWPHEPVELEGKRIGVIGTGSSGVQVITEVAKVADHLHVFQRTPNWSVPARRRFLDEAYIKQRFEEAEAFEKRMLAHPTGVDWPLPIGSSEEFTEEEQRKLLEEWWDKGGPEFLALFSDTGRNIRTNDMVSEFVREKIRGLVRDPDVAERLCPQYPIGTKRLLLDTGYYETFNQSNVTLVDLRSEPVDQFIPLGLRTKSSEYELDVVILALGFDAFTGALDSANIRNGLGASPTEAWRRGPRTYFGLMTVGFPNLFHPTAPGSPAVLANLCIQNVFQFDYITSIMSYMRDQGYMNVEPTLTAQDSWMAHCADVASPLLRVNVDNYMVHVNDDGTRMFMPYAGGFGEFVRRLKEAARNHFDGFMFSNPEN